MSADAANIGLAYGTSTLLRYTSFNLLYVYDSTTKFKIKFMFQAHALISTITLFFFSLLFVSIDQFLYTLLADLREYGSIQYTQIGEKKLSNTYVIPSTTSWETAYDKANTELEKFKTRGCAAVFYT